MNLPQGQRRGRKQNEGRTMPVNWPSAIVARLIWIAGRALCLIGLHRWRKHGRSFWRCSCCHKLDH